MVVKPSRISDMLVYCLSPYEIHLEMVRASYIWGRLLEAAGMPYFG